MKVKLRKLKDENQPCGDRRGRMSLTEMVESKREIERERERGRKGERKEQSKQLKALLLTIASF